MKKIILLTLIWVTCSGYAQNYYQGHETVEADGITFNVTFTYNSFMLSNAANIYDSEAAWRYKDGRKLETEAEYDSVDATRNMAGQSCAIREAFGDDVIVSLRKYRYAPLTLFYVVGPEGKTLEVAFIMDAKPELLALPPSFFATLERKLKEYVTWEINSFAQGLEFFQSFNFVFFRDIMTTSELPERIPTPDFDLDPGDLL